MSPADEIASASISPENSTSSEASDRLTFTVETITPNEASLILEKNPNGVPDNKAIATYAQSMENGAWIPNMMPIIFDEEGHLLDGVQRLHACVKAQQPFRTAIARGVRADTLHTIDQHRRRSYQSVLESRGVRDAGKVVRTMSKLIRIENGSLGRENLPISWSRYDRVFEANPELIEARDLSDYARSSSLHSTARPVLTFMAIRAGHKDELRSFLRDLGPDGTAPLDTPAGMFRVQMSVLKDNNTPVDTDKGLALAILAFNDQIAGKKVTKNYVWKPDYGNTPLDGDGEPISGAALREHAPANLGLPLVTGYPGLREGLYDTKAVADDFGGQIDESVKAATQTDDGNETITLMTVTPDMARKWLKYNVGNRKIQRNHIRMMARDIKNGRWQVNAQSICFTADPINPPADTVPRLLNGQHRLHAIIEADIQIEIPIAVGVQDEAFATYDTNAKRKVRQTGKRVDDRVLAAAAKLQWKQDSNLRLTSEGSPSASEIIETLNAHPHLADHFSRARRKGITEVGSAGVMTYVIYRVLSENPEWGEEFLTGLETGTDLGKGNPVLSLRKITTTNRKKLSRNETLNMLIEHWDAFKVWKGKLESKAAKDDEQIQPKLV